MNKNDEKSNESIMGQLIVAATEYEVFIQMMKEAKADLDKMKGK